MSLIQPDPENPFSSLISGQTEQTLSQTEQPMESEPLSPDEIEESTKKDLRASYEELIKTELLDAEIKRSIKGIDLLSKQKYTVGDVLDVNKERRTIKRKPFNMSFNIGRDVHTITMYPKNKDKSFNHKDIVDMWRKISLFVAFLIAKTMQRKGIVDVIVKLVNDLYKNYIKDDNIYIQETTIDCFTESDLQTRYGYSCLIRLIRKYVNALYTNADEIWKTAEGIAYNVGYEKEGSKKFSTHDRKIDYQARKEKALYKQLGGTWTTQLNGGGSISVYIHRKGEKSFSSILYDLGTKSILGTNLKLIENPRKDVSVDDELVEMITIYKLIKQFNALTNKSIENIPMVPLYTIDNAGIWDISNGKQYTTFKPVSLSSITGLRMPAIVSPTQHNPIANTEISTAIEDIITDAKLNGYAALTNAITLIGKKFNREMKIVKSGQKKIANKPVLTIQSQQTGISDLITDNPLLMT